MPRFVCKHCGMISERPEIHVDGISIGWLREGVTAPMPTGNDTHHFHIECPVCLGRTDFTRPESFPIDIPRMDNKAKLEYYLSTIPPRVI